MVTIILLAVIYFAFISLGLPDALLGTAWPVMHTEWGLALDSAGIISLIITAGTVVSSLMSGFVIKHIGTGKVTFISCLMTGLALLGFSFSQSFIWLILLSVPLGIGAGSVDAALNNYVALHFKAHHMNWLHSFWGVGATLGPLLMAVSLDGPTSWRGGYRTVALIQLSLSVILLLSLPLWGKHHALVKPKAEPRTQIEKVSFFNTKGLLFALVTFLCYCAVEISIGLWGASYLVAKHTPEEAAATWVAVYYGSITAGRFISGFVSIKVQNPVMIRAGIITAIIGTLLLFVPLELPVIGLPFILIGLGLAPIFPSMLHETPNRFGGHASQSIIGYQMASAYVGSALVPPVVGMLISRVNMGLFPLMMAVGLILVLISSETLTRRTRT